MNREEHKSQGDYLEAILIIGKGKDGVRCTDVAGCLDCSGVRVRLAVFRLWTRGLVRMGKGGLLYLTRAGQEKAECVYEKHCFFRQQLMNAGIDAETAEKEARRMKYDVSQDSFEKLRMHTMLCM